MVVSKFAILTVPKGLYFPPVRPVVIHI